MLGLRTRWRAWHRAATLGARHFSSTGRPHGEVTTTASVNDQRNPREGQWEPALRAPPRVQSEAEAVACKDSREQRQLIQDMAAAGIPPHVESIIGRLVAEGRQSEAKAVMEEMRAAGTEWNRMEPNHRTYAALNQSVSMQKTHELQGLVRTGKEADKQEAWRRFRELLDQGQADAYHCNVMMKACKDSGEQRQLMQDMATAGIQPDVVTYTTLVGRLAAEGRQSEAEGVMEEMRAAGVEPDRRTHAAPRHLRDSRYSDHAARPMSSAKDVDM